MSDAPENEANKGKGGSEQAGGFVAEMASLVRRLREILSERGDCTRVIESPVDVETLTERFGFAEKGKGRPEVVLAEDVAVELGHPSTPSKAIVLVTFEGGLVRGGRISIVGPDLDGMTDGSRRPFAQVVVLALRPGRAPDPFEVDNIQYLTHRLPGYMVRSVPGRLWVRVSKAGRKAGLTLRTVGSALMAAYMHDLPVVEAVEVVFVTSSPADVEALDLLATEASILAGRHKKLVLGLDGEVECRDLDCVTCEEKPVCDSLRDIVIKRRKSRR